jgi:Holliday junction resolvase
MSPTIKANAVTGKRAEAIAVEALRNAGFVVKDLNKFSKNFPLADLVAWSGKERLLVQVRSTTSAYRWFRITPEESRKFYDFCGVLGLSGLYAFVHLDEPQSDVVFGTGLDVADAAFDSVIHGVYVGVGMGNAAFVEADQIKTDLLGEDD